MARVLFAGGTAVFTFGVTVSAIEGQYTFAAAYVILAIPFAYLRYRYGREGRRPVGQDFNV